MMERDRLIELLNKKYDHFCDQCGVNKDSHYIENLADYVEVVRCKDCDIPHNKWTGCPKMNGLIPPPNHFCSYGERKQKNDKEV